MKRIIITFLILAFSGCATVSKKENTQLQQLQSRIGYLEQELRKKDAEINNLDEELKTYSFYEGKPGMSAKNEDMYSQGQLSVSQIQRGLKNSGFYKGAVDGKIGPKTRTAIKDFQKANGLIADGVVGKRTRLKLQKYL